MIEKIFTQEELEETIKSEIGVLLYFSTPTCNVCKALKPKIEEEFDKNFPLIKQYFIDSSIQPDIPASLNIFSVPTIVLFLDGREFLRESRNVSVSQFVDKTKRVYELLTS